MRPRAPKVALAALCAALAPPASAPTAQRCPSGEIDAVSEWGAARVGADIAEVLRSEQMDGGALALASVAELRSLGLPLGAALKLKACFATGGSTTASGWRTLAVTASHPLTVAKDTVLPATTSVEVSDGGTINVASGVTLAINGTFSAPPQHVFVGPGRVLLSGDESGRAYPQWWGATADGDADAARAIQSAVFAARGVGTGLEPAGVGGGSSLLPATVFLTPGTYSVSETIVLPDHTTLQGAGPYATQLLATPELKARPVLAPPAGGVNRTDGWRISSLALRGQGRSAAPGSGLQLLQTSRAVVRDVGISGFKECLFLSGVWTADPIPCMYNIFQVRPPASASAERLACLLTLSRANAPGSLPLRLRGCGVCELLHRESLPQHHHRRRRHRLPPELHQPDRHL